MGGNILRMISQSTPMRFITQKCRMPRNFDGMELGLVVDFSSKR